MKRSALMVLAAGLAIGVLAAEQAAAPAAPVLKFSGDLQYRLRYHWLRTQKNQSDFGATGDYVNAYMWNFRVTATVSENLMMGIRLSNPSGAACDKVMTNTTWDFDPAPGTYNAGNAYVGLGYNLLAIPEMYLKWTPGAFALSAGFIPVSGSTVLDLMAYESKAYDFWSPSVGLIAPFDVTFNNSLRGLDLAYMFMKNDESSVAADLVVALANDAPGSRALEQLKRDQWRFILTTPIGLMSNMITVKPAFTVRTNMYRSADLLKWDAGYLGGVDVICKPTKDITAKVGGAVGGYNNDAWDGKYSPAAWDTAKIGPRGVLAVAGLNAAAGPGTLMIDYNYCFSEDVFGNYYRTPNSTSHAFVNVHQSFVDLKYAYPVKKLAFIPRLRVWYQTKTAEDVSNLTIRPEMIFKASF